MNFSAPPEWRANPGSTAKPTVSWVMDQVAGTVGVENRHHIHLRAKGVAVGGTQLVHQAAQGMGMLVTVQHVHHRETLSGFSFDQVAGHVYPYFPFFPRGF